MNDPFDSIFATVSISEIREKYALYVIVPETAEADFQETVTEVFCTLEKTRFGSGMLKEEEEEFAEAIALKIPPTKKKPAGLETSKEVFFVLRQFGSRESAKRRQRIDLFILYTTSQYASLFRNCSNKYAKADCF